MRDAGYVMFKKYISSTIYKNDFAKVVEFAEEHDYGVEISRFGKLRNIQNDFEDVLENYKNKLKGFNNGLTLHGFFSNLCVASQDPEIAQISKKRYEQSFRIAKELGAHTVVFHTTFNNLLKHTEYKNIFFDKTVKFYTEFIKNFEDEGITAVIENVHESDPSLILRILDAVASKNLKACIDAGHVNLHSQLSVSEWIKLYGKKLHHMHIHNNYGNEDAHSSLKKGSVDYIKVFNTLKSENLSPGMVLEIFDEADVIESVKFFNEHTVNY